MAAKTQKYLIKEGRDAVFVDASLTITLSRPMKTDVEISIKPAKDAFRTTQELLMWKWVAESATQSGKSKDDIYGIFKVLYLWPVIKSKLPQVEAIESLIKMLPEKKRDAVFAPHISHDKANKPELDEALTNFYSETSKRYKLSSPSYYIKERDKQPFMQKAEK